MTTESQPSVPATERATDSPGDVSPFALGLLMRRAHDRAASALVQALRPLGLDPTELEPMEAAWRTTATTYVVCTNDGAIPPEAQRAMAANAGVVVEWPADHSPFLTRPAAVADLVCSYLPGPAD